MISKELNKDEKLYEVIQILTSNFLIECIYRSDFHGSTGHIELFLLVSNKYVNIIGEITPKMINSIRSFDTYHIKCFVAFQTREKIKKGNLFLFSTCQPENLVYQKRDSKFSAIPNDFDPMKCFDLFQKLQEREAQKIDEFRDGYYHFKARSHYPMAAFMVHQVLELTYRNLEIMLTGKERITHSIRSHNMALQIIYPYLRPVFDFDRRSDNDLLRTLEEIYRATRYEDGFQIAPEALERIEKKMDALRELSDSISIKITTNFRHHYPIADQTNHMDGSEDA
ncbi:HEPN domain-containing protein [Sphingobacterium endophyticum]|uniref:HEPN domain-containing protein n=1 Tax=Sphingobacterium endophyticum TaxID=2546448 RepID=UPI0012E17677|nr:HEPN domain-containing protein [Sphingobacterium endophyticum]